MLICSPKKYKCSLCTYDTNKKYNYERHTYTVHSSNYNNVYIDTQNNDNITQINNTDTQINNTDTQINNIDTQINNIDTQNINIPVEKKVYKCPDCYKTFPRKYNLERHIPNCNRRQHPYQCTACLKCFTCSSGLSQHKAYCKGQQLIPHNSQSKEVVPSGSTNTNVNAENVQMIQQQQNANTINNTVNINILPCPQSREEKFDFDCENITFDDLMGILQKSKDSFLRFNRFVSKVLENPKNRVVRKLSAKDCHSLVHIGDDKWELAHDNDTFPIITHHMTTAALGKSIELDKNDKNYFIRAFQEQIRIFNEMDYDSLDYNSIVQRIKYHVINITRAVLAEEKRIQKETECASK